MAKTQTLPVEDLSLDLHNFRMVPQTTEKGSIQGMVAVNPDWFWALMESLADDGYLPTENILVLKEGGKNVVKEGNRRIAVLKLIHGYIKRGPFRVPDHLEKKIRALTSEWLEANKEVPCTIYEAKESAKVDRIVNLAHGKGEKAGRDKWEAVARARHDRDVNHVSVPALDLLERYLKHGSNITAFQRDRWGGDYPYSVLEEAIKKIAPRFNMNSRELADAYPNKVKDRPELESVLLAIGLGTLSFDAMRHQGALDNFGLPAAPAPANLQSAKPSPGGVAPSGGSPASGVQPTPVANTKPTKPTAYPLDSPASVRAALGRFKIVGLNRGKVAVLRNEARNLKLDKNPYAFCFLLRSMFEISAKAYCKDHEKANGPKAAKDGRDRPLVEMLRDVYEHIKKNSTDQQMHKTLHGAMTQIAKPSGLLSITSMNQLIHSEKFTTDQSHICSVFHNIFPLLEAMNL